MRPAVSFKTVGCRLNQAETEELSALFEKSGFAVKPYGTDTDVVVIHTCAVTARAESECIRFARSSKRKNPKTILVMTGCAVEVDKALLERKCGVNLAAGQDEKFSLPEKVSALLNIIPAPAKRRLITRNRVRAIVKIQTGCDFHCTYCIVPSARGTPVNEPADDILSRITSLSQQGIKEIILTGANLGCYSRKNDDIIRLLEEIERIDGIERIRLSSIELTTAEIPLIKHIKRSDKICRHLHIPLQSGSDPVLKRMHRKYSAQEYREFCESALSELPDLALGADIIAGFPGETNEDFSTSVELIRSIPFSNIHVFKYSIRKGTAAAEMPDQIPPEIKKARSNTLLKLARRKKNEFAKNLIGKACSVLIESKDESGRVSGWTKEYIRAEFPAPHSSINDIVTFTPVTAHNGTVSG